MWRDRAGRVFECEKKPMTAPRVFTQGQEAEIEKGFPESVRAKLAGLGHTVAAVDQWRAACVLLVSRRMAR